MRIVPFLVLLTLATDAVDSRPPAPAGGAVYRRACDGSATVTAPGGLIVSGNDEDNGLRVYRQTGGKPLGEPVDMSRYLGMAAGDEADIEDAATKGALTFWITSHGRTKRGGVRPERQRLFATRWDGHAPVPAGRARDDLLVALLAAPTLAGLPLREAAGKAGEAGGINIEGLADGPGASLLIGFRGPLIGRGARALIVPLLDAPAVVESGAAIRFGAPALLDLGGRGVRGMARLPDGRYLIVAGGTGSGGSFGLFTWSGRPGDAPVFAGTPPPGLSPEAAVVLPNGTLMLFSDDGTKACKAAATRRKSFRGQVVTLR